MIYRYFLNVDNCINDDKFDFFFFKNRAIDNMMLFPDVRSGNNSTFKKAAAEIRLHLDQNALTIDNHEIIIVVNGVLGGDYKWSDSLLCKLIQIYSELVRFNIYFGRNSSRSCEVSVFAVYENKNISNFRPLNELYLDSGRFKNDYVLLLQKLSIEPNCDYKVEELNNKFEDLFSRRKIDDSLYSVLRLVLDGIKQDTINFSAFFFKCIQDMVERFLISELSFGVSDLSERMLSMLRIVEYSTIDLESYKQAIQVNNPSSDVTLKSMCQAGWQEVSSSKNTEILKHKYSRLLQLYRKDLRDFLANSSFDESVSEDLSTFRIERLPEETALGDGLVFWDLQDNVKEKYNPKDIVKKFIRSLGAISRWKNAWNMAYSSLKDISISAQKAFLNYETALGEEYFKTLLTRKETFLKERDSICKYDESIGEGIKDLEVKKVDILNELRKPEMSPKMIYQDQLNLDEKLENANEEIFYYIRCAESVSMKTFLVLLIVLVGIVTVLYAFLEPYVLFDILTPTVFVAYIAAVALIMSLAWNSCRLYYKRKIIICVNALEESMEKCIQGYFVRAAQLQRYVNLINILDFIERELKYRRKSKDFFDWSTDVRNWYRQKAKEYDEKVDFFSSLIAKTQLQSAENLDEDVSGDVGFQSDNDVRYVLPAINIDRYVSDIKNCNLFWLDK